jgi:predicted small lipoprotein YifL
MKNINLCLSTLLFASVLAGCGKTGPLYRTPEPAPVVEQQNIAPNTTQSSLQTPDSNTQKSNASE